MIALIIGATGATGKDLVTQLLKDADFKEVHVFVRKALKLEDPKLKVHVVDFEHPEDWKNLVKGDVAFSCLGTTLKAAGSKGAKEKGDDGGKKDDLKNMSAAMKKLKDLEGHKPMTRPEISAAVEKIKKQYKVPVSFTAQGNDFWMVNAGAKAKQPVMVLKHAPG